MLSPALLKLIPWAFLLVMIPIAAFILRNVCGLFRAELPSWKRAIVMVLFIGPAAYLTFDFTAYLMLLSVQDVYVNLPPGYGFHQWMSEPWALKWRVINLVPLVRYLPFLFTIAVAGSLQSIFLQLQVPYRLAVVMLVVQWGVTLAVAYGLALGLNYGLAAAGPALADAGAKAGAGAGAGAGAAPREAPGAAAVAVKEAAGDVALSARSLLSHAQEKLTNHFRPVLEDLDEATGPVTRRLPEPVQRFLDEGGWWAVLAVVGLVALLGLRSIARRIVGAVAPTRKKKGKKKPQTRVVPIDLRASLEELGEASTEEGPRQITVKGVSARLRLIVLAPGNKDVGRLHKDMADTVLDWIRPGLSEIAGYDCPRVVLWPPHYSKAGFARSFAANVQVPGGKGQRSAWVLVSGQAEMGRQRLQVGLVLHTSEPTSLRHLEVSGEGWLDAIGMTQPALAGRR